MEKFLSPNEGLLEIKNYQGYLLLLLGNLGKNNEGLGWLESNWKLEIVKDLTNICLFSNMFEVNNMFGHFYC